jgi:hypothetical protein
MGMHGGPDSDAWSTAGGTLDMFEVPAAF